MKKTATPKTTTKTAPAADGKKQVQAYIAAQPPVARRALKQVVAAIRAVAPAAVASISYRIPTFKLDGRPLVYCAAFRNHYSLYPIGTALLEKLGVEGYETSKGTIRFPLDEPAPTALVKRIVKARIAQLRAGEKV